MMLADFIGIPYRPLGRDKSGTDCWGLVSLYYRAALGIELPDYTYLNTRDSIFSAILGNLSAWELREPIEANDVLLFRIFGIPYHVGIYLGDGDFLHSFNGTESCIERLNSINWKPRLLGAYRWINK